MKTRIYLSFTENTKIGKFVQEHEIMDKDEFIEGIFEVTGMKHIPRIGETFHTGYEGYKYQKKFLELFDKMGADSKLMEEDIEYRVVDVHHSFGQSRKGRQIHFIQILLDLSTTGLFFFTMHRDNFKEYQKTLKQ